MGLERSMTLLSVHYTLLDAGFDMPAHNMACQLTCFFHSPDIPADTLCRRPSGRVRSWAAAGSCHVIEILAGKALSQEIA